MSSEGDHKPRSVATAQPHAERYLSPSEMSLDVSQDAGPGDLVTTDWGQASEGSHTTVRFLEGRGFVLHTRYTFMDKCVIQSDARGV